MLLRGQRPQCVHIRNDRITRLVGKISPVFFCLHRRSVSQMVMSYHKEAKRRQIRGKGVIPVNILDHAVRDLQNCPVLCGIRQPAHCMDLCLSIFR